MHNKESLTPYNTTENAYKLTNFQLRLKEFRETEFTLSKNAEIVVHILKRFNNNFNQDFNIKTIYSKALLAFENIAKGGDVWSEIITGNWENEEASSNVIENILKKLTDANIQKRYKCCAEIAMYYEVPIKNFLANIDQNELSLYLKNDLANLLPNNEHSMPVAMRLSTPMQRLPRLVLFAKEFHSINQTEFTERLLRKFTNLCIDFNSALTKLASTAHNMIISNSMQIFMNALEANNILKEAIHYLDDSKLSISNGVIEETQPLDIDPLTVQPGILNLNWQALQELSQIEDIEDPELIQSENQLSSDSTDSDITFQIDHIEDSTKIVLNQLMQKEISPIEDSKIEQQLAFPAKTPSSHEKKILNDIVLLTSIIASSTAVGAIFGAFLGTLVLPGFLTIAGTVLGAALGGTFGLMMAGFQGLIRNRLIGAVNVYIERVFAGTLTTIGTTAYGAIIGTIIWPGVGSLIGGGIGLIIGAALSVATAYAFDIDAENNKPNIMDEPAFIDDLEPEIRHIDRNHTPLFTNKTSANVNPEAHPELVIKENNGGSRLSL